MTARPQESGVGIPRNYLRPCLLLLLAEGTSHGYELLEQVGSLGLDRVDPGGLYRCLRAMDEEGLVRSAWEPSTQGPDRRIYEITRPGAESLYEVALSVRAGSEIMGRFVSRYEEFVTLPSKRARAGRH